MGTNEKDLRLRLRVLEWAINFPGICTKTSVFDLADLFYNYVTQHENPGKTKMKEAV